MRRSLLATIAFALVAALVPGCGSVTKHQVLTFFFTGVPEPGTEGAKAKAAKAGSPDQAAGGPRSRPEARSIVVKATRYGHGPYASNECYACHEVSGSGGLRGFGKKEEAAGSIAKAGIVPGKLVAPVRELCAGCHADSEPYRAEKAGLAVHGPVSGGLCVLCHAPHAGDEQYLLPKKADALCADCHTPGMIVSKAVHEGRGDCSACHDAHAGKDRRLLRPDYRETS